MAVAQVADAVGFKERFVLGRSVDEADVIVDVDADVLVIEALWSQTAVTMEVAILVAVFKVKALWRFAQADAQHIVDGGKHLFLLLAQLFDAGSVLVSFAQDAGKLAQLFGHVAVHLLGGGGDYTLRHGSFWNQTVLVDKVAQHIPLTAVVERSRNQMGDQSAVAWLIQRFQNAFQEVVGFFQFIVEQGVALGKLKVFQIQFVHHLKTQAVEGCKHPAATALFLVGDLALF